MSTWAHECDTLCIAFVRPFSVMGKIMSALYPEVIHFRTTVEQRAKLDLAARKRSTYPATILRELVDTLPAEFKTVQRRKKTKRKTK